SITPRRFATPCAPNPCLRCVPSPSARPDTFRYFSEVDMPLQSEPKPPSVNSASLAEIRAALKEGRFEAARLEASRLLEMNPQSVDAGSLVAEALLGMGRLAEALPLLQVLTKVRPRSEEHTSELQSR